MKANKKSMMFSILGIATAAALFVAGMILRDNAAKEITGVCFGLGAGLFGMFMANLINSLIESKNPEVVRAKNIAENDERNTAIHEKAGSKVNRVLGVILPIVTLIFVFMDVQLAVTLIMCGLILLQAFLSIYYHGYYNKRM